MKALISALTVVSLALLAVASRSADACSVRAPSTVAGLSVLPLNDSVAPLNTKIWVLNSPVTDAGMPGVRLLTALGVEIPMTRTEVTAGFDQDRLSIFTPTTALSPNTPYQIHIEGQRFQSFVTTAENDTTPPEKPVIMASEVKGQGTYAGPCGSSPAFATLTYAPKADLAMLVTPEDLKPTLPTTARFISGTESLGTNFMNATGAETFNAIAIDLAGNVSTAEPLSITPPEPRVGCSSTRLSFQGLALLAVAVLLSRAQRSRSASV